jgi:parallel beta-helix repeat protein
VQGSSNSLRWNETSGNGYATPNDDFGIGVMSGNNNVVEENTAIGNTNGIIIFPPATATVIRGNIVMGNPPIQVSVALPGTTGVDIWDQSARGQTVFDRNLCGSSINAPCPNLSSLLPRKPPQ